MTNFVLVVVAEADEVVLAGGSDDAGNLRVVVDGDALAADLSIEELAIK